MTKIIRHIFDRCCFYIFLITAGTYIISKIPVDYYILDVLDHFQSFYFCLFLFTAIAGFLGIANRRIAVSALLTLVISLIITFTPLIGHTTINKKQNSPAFKILSMNLYYNNSNYSAIVDLIRQENPDILALIELNPRQQQVIEKSLPAEYFYKYIKAKDNPTGIGLYTKYTVLSADFYDKTNLGFGFISSAIAIENKKYNLLVIHPSPPIFQYSWEWRNETIASFKNHLANPNDETIVIGDFNTTMWSSDFSTLLSSLKVNVNLQAPGTWPAIRFFPKIGIDNVLLPESLTYAYIQSGPNIGSDHLPIIAKVNRKLSL